jgi:hypothetical protein
MGQSRSNSVVRPVGLWPKTFLRSVVDGKAGDGVLRTVYGARGKPVTDCPARVFFARIPETATCCRTVTLSGGIAARAVRR